MDVKREWLETDYYAALGVSPSASDKEITKAYRKLARQLHPDTNPGDTKTEERFKEVTAAYDVLGDSERRSQYDQVRSMGPMNFQTGSRGFTVEGDLADLFSSFRRSSGSYGPDIYETLHSQRRSGRFAGQSHPKQGENLVTKTELELDFAEAVRGTTASLTLQGAAEGDLKVKIPAGVNDGQTIRVRGKGFPGFNGGPPGDLDIVVRVRPHPTFGRQGRNLLVTLPVDFTAAALGADVPVTTFEGEKVTIRLPPGTQPGRTFRVRDRGITTAKGTGDLLVTVQVQVPETLTDEQRQALVAYAALVDGSDAPTPPNQASEDQASEDQASEDQSTGGSA